MISSLINKASYYLVEIVVKGKLQIVNDQLKIVKATTFQLPAPHKVFFIKII